MPRVTRFLLVGAIALVLNVVMPGGPEGPGLLVAAAAAKTGKAGKEQGKKKEKRPTDVTADSMEIIDEKNRILFTGNVKVVQGDTTLYADKLEVLTEKEKNAKGEDSTRMRQWLATGHVRIVKPDMTITGNKAIMDVKKDIVTVEGNVVVKKPDATIRGEKLVANLKTNVTRVLSTKRKQRVHGIFR